MRSPSDVLNGLLAAEYAAIYAYGDLGAHLPDSSRRLALAAFDAHRAARDDLRALLPGATGPAAAYDVTVTSPTTALALAVRIEDDLALRWHDLVGATSDAALRRRGVQGLQDSAVRAAQWRRLAGSAPLTEPFPGSP